MVSADAMYRALGVSYRCMSVSASLPPVGHARTLGLTNPNGKYMRLRIQLSQLWTAVAWRRVLESHKSI
jgi:hypothetical protein